MSDTAHDEILRSTVRLARLSFSADAASLSLIDHDRGTLVFEAASGAGEDTLINRSIPADRGLAGWVVNTGEPILIRGAAEDARFDRDFASATGLIPDVIMATPVEHDGDILGVLEVLEPRLDAVGDMAAIDILTELANQSCAALSLLIADRRERARRTEDTGAFRQLSRILAHAGPGRESAVEEMLTAMARLVG